MASTDAQAEIGTDPKNAESTIKTVATTGTYDDALQTLYNMLKNEALLHDRQPITNSIVMESTMEYLERGGLTMQQLDRLKVIHVSGTKGKGSTCAFTESILRHAGLRTGFASSPHLITTRERIRINGRAISKDKFAKYFFQFHSKLHQAQEFENDMPSWFRFMTCLFYYILYQESVEVAIIEVGVGGRFCPTNVIRKPIVTGITSLAVEHVFQLGNTIEMIADQKGGIMKKDVPCYTTYSHSPECFEVLQKCADTVQCPLFVAHPLSTYTDVDDICFGINGPVSTENASIALELANTFLEKFHPEILGRRPQTKEESGTNVPRYPILPFHKDGLENCTFHGRFHILNVSLNVTYYLEGAHTEKSLDVALDWFLRITPESTFRILVFRVGGERSPENLLQAFLRQKSKFQMAIFSPLYLPISDEHPKPSPDRWARAELDQEELDTSKLLASVWNKDSEGEEGSSQGIAFESIDQVIKHIDSLTNSSISVLVTGSLHLVGTYLSILDPELVDTI